MVKEDNGVFFMLWEDYFKNFSTTELCYESDQATSLERLCIDHDFN